uniref:TPR_REGION domain-containing protein n=2 Tax=Macrostomum lignano TaxID=282301 RepID=A0A1I8H4H5_9PLAT
MLAYSMLIDSPDGQQSGFLPDAYAGRSECLRQLEQLYHSLEDADRVCLLRPRWPRGHALRGEALLAGGQPAEALAAFREAARLDPGDELLLDRARRSVEEIRSEASATSRLMRRSVLLAAGLALLLALLDLAALEG